MVECEVKKVFIGSPIHKRKDYCMDMFAHFVLHLSHNPKKLVLVDNSMDESYINLLKYKYGPVSPGFIEYYHINFDTDMKEMGRMHQRLVASYNLLRDLFLKSDYEFFLSLECDVMIPPDALTKLLDADKDIVQGFYYPGFFQEFNTIGDSLYKLKDDRGLSGITLIKRKVLEKIQFRYDPTMLGAFQDAFFFHDAAVLGFESWLHGGVRATHLPGWQ